MEEHSFELIQKTADSIIWRQPDGNVVYKLAYGKTVFSIDSMWVLISNHNLSYVLKSINKDSLILEPNGNDFLPTTLTHAKPKPSSTLAKDSLINKISGFWYAKYGRYEVNFERISSSPDSVLVSWYTNDTLHNSAICKVALLYQSFWALIYNKYSSIGISLYEDGIGLGMLGCGLCGEVPGRGTPYIRTDPLEIPSIGNKKSALDSAISLLTSRVWYNAKTGDLPLEEHSFEFIPNTANSIIWKQPDYTILSNLVYKKSIFSLDSIWELMCNNFIGYELKTINKDSLILEKAATNSCPTILTHAKPQPSSALAKDSLINKISGFWYAKYGRYEVNFERISSSPDSILVSRYANDTLLYSAIYKVALIYQSFWALINNKHSSIGISLYEDGIGLGLLDCGFCGEVPGRGTPYIRTDPLEIPGNCVLPNNPALFPNPCTNSFTLQGNFAISSVEIIGLNGQVQLTKTFHKKNNVTIDITGLPKGVYIVRSISKNACFTAKIIKE